MIIKTRVFELANGKYHNLSDLARAMELSISQVYRVRVGKRGINEKFLVGAKRHFRNTDWMNCSILVMLEYPMAR